MTEQDFIQRTQDRLEAFRSQERRRQERFAMDLRQLQGLRVPLSILAGSLALSLGLSVGYQMGRH